MERRAWPTAPTTTRVSPAKRPTTPADRQPSATAKSPIPATVWTAGHHPIDLDATWPTALVEKLVTAFSQPAAKVVLLAHPHTTTHDAALDGVIDHAPGMPPDPELADALHTIEHLGRTAQLRHIPDTTPTHQPRRLRSVDTAAQPRFTAPGIGTNVATDGSHDADLVIASLRPEHSGEQSADLVAALATHLLRVGGILAVLTHCDWAPGELTDPTGAVVAAGQNADLLYLQHIVALHTPLHNGEFHPAHHNDNDAAARAHHRAQVRGLPAPHLRIHSDVLVFAQPHDHRPPPLTAPTHQRALDGDIR
ncbi:hypothetical protein DFJ66_2747 [Saccharothrix variisporea]|uniref:Uncharacterized protein n=1 Tax=Saccharothrix variisporea TaxID=543527 RepID=A0A495X812_9PSEU|nr:hypothetical protein DFJ66_2747 [Saccharothrix variisporea]